MLGDLDPIPLLCNQLEVSIPWMEVQILLHQLNKLDKKYIKCYDVILSIQFHMTNLEDTLNPTPVVAYFSFY